MTGYRAGAMQEGNREEIGRILGKPSDHHASLTQRKRRGEVRRKLPRLPLGNP